MINNSIKPITLNVSQLDMLMIRDALSDKLCELKSNDNGVVQPQSKWDEVFSEGRIENIHRCMDLLNTVKSLIKK